MNNKESVALHHLKAKNFSNLPGAAELSNSPDPINLNTVHDNDANLIYKPVKPTYLWNIAQNF